MTPQRWNILLLGCDVAEGNRGQAFVQRLADLTQADVSASIDDTGTAAQGGNWTLEFNVGERDSQLVFSQQALDSYRELLPAGPTTTLTLPASTLIGATDQAGSVSFDNTGTSVGYAPYVAVAFDSNRSPDPSTNNAEGITYTPGSATYLAHGDRRHGGADLQCRPVTRRRRQRARPGHRPAGGVHGGVIRHAGAGDTLVIYQLPFGSFTPDNPPAKIDFKYNVGAQCRLSPITVSQGGEGAAGAGRISSRGFLPAGRDAAGRNHGRRRPDRVSGCSHARHHQPGLVPHRLHQQLA